MITVDERETAAAPAPAAPAARAERIRVEQHSASGMIWLAGWLFTIGYLQLPLFWKGLLALLLWPFYLGGAIAPPAP